MVTGMRLATVRRKYRDEWVALRVLRTDKADAPVEGEVVAHSRNDRTLHDRARHYLTSHPGVRLFIFFAGEPIDKDLAACLATQ